MRTKNGIPADRLKESTPIQTDKFQWDLGFNFSKNYNKVLSLPESLEGGKVNIYSFSSGNDAVYMYAEQGKALGQFYTYLPPGFPRSCFSRRGPKPSFPIMSVSLRAIPPCRIWRTRPRRSRFFLCLASGYCQGA